MTPSPSQPARPPEVCGRVIVGSGPDSYDPVCELPSGHEGPCRSSAAIDQHRILLASSPASQPPSEPASEDEPDWWGPVERQRAAEIREGEGRIERVWHWRARAAELERERDELRAHVSELEQAAWEVVRSARRETHKLSTVHDTTIDRLRALLPDSEGGEG